MNTTGTDLLVSVTASLTALLAKALEGVFGPGVDTPVIGLITWADLGVSLCFLALVLLINAAAAFYIRRKQRQTTNRYDSKDWRAQLLGTVGKPLYLLIWIYGLYLAAAPLLLRLPSPHPLRQICDDVFGLGLFIAVFWLVFRLTHVIEARLAAWAAKTESKLDDLVVPLLGRSLRVIVPVVGIILALPLIGMSPDYAGVVAKASSILLIVTVAWILFEVVSLGERAVLARYDIAVADNLNARKIHTQVHVLGKTLYFLIVLFTAASILMLFEEVRRFGTSILASAGVIGIILGFAAQRTIANLFAGFQLALTQPIRLDDVVIVEGEWGRVEEITLTYVVIKIWDERRLVVPLSQFIEKPFQNWTRVSANLLGSVFIWVDYSMPLDKVREITKQIVEVSPLWDKRFWNLQVTDTTDRAVQIRVLATAADSGKAWDLRCEIREKLIIALQNHFPENLPCTRFRFEQNGERNNL